MPHIRYLILVGTNLVNKIKHIEPRNEKLLNEENESNGKISPEGSMNLNIENNKIQLEDSDTKNEKGDSEKNIYAIEPNNEEKKEEKKKKRNKL